MNLIQIIILVYSFLPLSQGKSSSFDSSISFVKFSLGEKSKEIPKKRTIRSSTCLFVKSVRGGEKSSSSSSPSPFLSNKVPLDIDFQPLSSQNMDNNSTSSLSYNFPLNFVFSDVDGTLVHYPKEKLHQEDDDHDNDVIHLPPSSTGMRGVISSKTLKLCQSLRHECNVKLVLVSGMRTSTLLKRLPYLPKADA